MSAAAVVKNWLWVALTLISLRLHATPHCDPAEFDKEMAARSKNLQAILDGLPSQLMAGECARPKPPPGTPGEVRHVELPVTPGGERKFDYNYAFYKAKGEGKKTIVMIGGGPGMPWIERGRPPMAIDDCNVIVIEYKGVGKNKIADVKDFDQTFSIEQEADAVNAVIKQEKLNDYVIYGQSFGTTVATVAASKLSHDNSATKPHGVLLEGTLGHANHDRVRSQNQVVSGYANTSNLAYNLLNKEEQGKLKAKIESLRAILGPQQEEILNGFFMRPLPGGAKVTAAYLRKFVSEPNLKTLSCLKADMAQSKAGPKGDKSAADYYAVMGCAVMDTSSEESRFKMFNGLLSGLENTQICQCSRSKQRGTYDSKKYPIKDVPLFYINGDSDPNTPLTQQKYHFRNQQETNKAEMIIKGGGHGEFFNGSLSSAECKKRVWANVFAGQLEGFAGLQETSECSQPPQPPAPPRTHPQTAD